MPYNAIGKHDLGAVVAGDIGNGRRPDVAVTGGVFVVVDLVQVAVERTNGLETAVGALE